MTAEVGNHFADEMIGGQWGVGVSVKRLSGEGFWRNAVRGRRGLLEG